MPVSYISAVDARGGSREGEMGEFSPPFSEPLSSSFFSYPSNIEIIFDFSDIITKIHPSFQNPGSALGCPTCCVVICNYMEKEYI